MYHYLNSITNTQGDALVGYFVKAIDTSDGSVVDIYADSSGTAIETVSGQANAAEVDSDGNVSLYVPGGTYHLDIYATDATTFVKRISEVQMVDFATLSTSDIGYAVGAGGFVTQQTSKSTAVTLDTYCGQITMNGASLAAGATVGFTVNNAKVTSSHTVIINVLNASGYHVWIAKVSSGLFNVVVQNTSAGALAEAITLNFALLKIVTA